MTSKLHAQAELLHMELFIWEKTPFCFLFFSGTDPVFRVMASIE